jgi:hypothetical protein
MQVRFRRQNCRSCASSWVASGRDRFPKPPTAALLANRPVRHKIVIRAQQLEVVQVIDHRNPLPLQLPKNRWREMVIDVAYMRHIGTKLTQQVRQLCARTSRINRVRCKSHTTQRAVPLIFEVHMRRKELVKIRRLVACVPHRKHCGGVAGVAQHLRKIEQVRLGSAESKVIFVAEQDIHNLLR